MSYKTLVTAQTLEQHLVDPDWVVVDCRFSLADTEAGRRAYVEGHIPGAVYAHLDEDLSGEITSQTGRHPLPKIDKLCTRLGQWGISRQTQVVVYDDMNGAMAARLWWLLRSMGHEGVALLDGGWQQWLQAEYAQSSEVPAPQEKVYGAELSRDAWLSSDEVMSLLGDGSKILLDARAGARFRGEVEPIDPVAGHVPGALNRPFECNLTSDGRFKTSVQLADEFVELLADRVAGDVVHMCGSGVTACHNLLAMEVAGLCGSRLYAGSWSEWIRDSQRPVATG